MNILSLMKKKHKHDWEYTPKPEYDPHDTRWCKTCGLVHFWHEVHYGTWETDPRTEKPGK